MKRSTSQFATLALAALVAFGVTSVVAVAQQPRAAKN